jgi:plastocyanin
VRQAVRRIAFAAIPTLVVLSACGSTDPAAPTLVPSPDVVEVRLVERPDDVERPFAFEPSEATVPVGTTVRWVNELDVFHTVTFTDSIEERVSNGTFDSSLATRDATVERVFDTPGTFAYFCQPHSPFMFATITVR